MISARRSTWNHGLQHAIELANQRNMPLVVVEVSYRPSMGERPLLHFVIQGMMDNKKAFEDTPTYIPYVETKRYEARGLLEKWIEYADVLVIDEFPVYARRIKEISNLNRKVRSTQCRFKWFYFTTSKQRLHNRLFTS